MIPVQSYVRGLLYVFGACTYWVPELQHSLGIGVLPILLQLCLWLSLWGKKGWDVASALWPRVYFPAGGLQFSFSWFGRGIVFSATTCFPSLGGNGGGPHIHLLLSVVCSQSPCLSLLDSHLVACWDCCPYCSSYGEWSD